MLLSSPWISPTLFPSSLFPPTILLSPLAGKRSWSAMETEWLRRRPGRCTEDKFVCVSWAATLCSRTLTRSCQWEGKSRPSTSSAHLLPHCPPPSTPNPTASTPGLHSSSVGARGEYTPHGAKTFLWDPRILPWTHRHLLHAQWRCHKHTYTHSQNSIKHTIGPPR